MARPRLAGLEKALKALRAEDQEIARLIMDATLAIPQAVDVEGLPLLVSPIRPGSAAPPSATLPPASPPATELRQGSRVRYAGMAGTVDRDVTEGQLVPITLDGGVAVVVPRRELILE